MKEYISIPQSSSKDLSTIERAVKRIIDYVNSAQIDISKEYIVRLFISSYRNLCSLQPEVIDTISLTRLLILLNDAIVNEYCINGSECAFVYSYKSLIIKQNLRYLANKYIESRNLILIKEAFTKKAIEYIVSNNMNMPHQMSELPAEISTEKIDMNSLHGILIVFKKQEDNTIERSRYYNIETLCEIARKKIIESKVCEISGKPTIGPWSTDTIEMFKKTALKNIMKDITFI